MSWAWFALLGCDGEPPPGDSLGPEASGWVAEVVGDPGLFAARVSQHREGWVALHANDWNSAAAAGGDPAQRAHAELARFYRVLAGAQASAYARLGARWSARGLDPNSQVHDVARSSELDSVATGRVQVSWRGEVPEAVTTRAQLHDRLRDPATPPDPADVASLLAVAPLPLLTEPGDGALRAFPDPWLLHTLARVEARLAEPAALDTTLFSGALDARGAVPHLPPPPAAGAADTVADAEACRVRVREVDAELDAWRTALAGSASNEGRALMQELRLVDATRARALVDMAVVALDQGRPACSLAIGQLALDHESPRAVSPVNSPTLFAAVAASALGVGKSREALDALEPLREAFPAVAPLDETINTLAILEGIDRRGDSRE